MKLSNKLFFLVATTLSLSSCMTKKAFEQKVAETKQQLSYKTEQLESCNMKVAVLEDENKRLSAEQKNLQSYLNLREEQIKDFKSQIDDLKNQRDKQAGQVGDLTNLSKSATDNIRETLSQLEKKEKYIRYLQEAKTRADSINLALSVNLKGVLKDDIADKDVDVKVDKSVIFINLSDKMLFKTGSYQLTPRATEVLGKIAKIIESRPDLEVMVEGYTDNVPIKKDCFEDNWDLSVRRSTSVVRILQQTFKVNPNRLIAAGRGEYNALATNTTPEGRSTNRRTRIIILPKVDQFYDLLNPNNAPK